MRIVPGMKTIATLFAFGCIALALLLADAHVLAAGAATSQSSGNYVNVTWQVAGERRTGILWIPGGDQKKPEKGWPVVFVFHGHGGTAQHSKNRFALEQNWPGAVVVYLQGLPTKGPLTDPEGKKNGWDMNTEPEKNRDVQLFDLVLESLKKEYAIDPAHVYVTGHSNGGGFTYYLWAYRGDKLDAVAPSAAALGPTKGARTFAPKPAMIIAGTNDPLVKFAWQQGMMEIAKKVNQCKAQGKPWGNDATWYDSPLDAPVVTLIHDKGHMPPENLSQRVADFFKLMTQRQ